MQQNSGWSLASDRSSLPASHDDRPAKRAQHSTAPAFVSAASLASDPAFSQPQTSNRPAQRRSSQPVSHQSKTSRSNKAEEEEQDEEIIDLVDSPGSPGIPADMLHITTLLLSLAPQAYSKEQMGGSADERHSRALQSCVSINQNGFGCKT